MPDMQAATEIVIALNEWLHRPRMITGAALIALTLAVVGIIAYIVTHPLD